MWILIVKLGRKQLTSPINVENHHSQRLCYWNMFLLIHWHAVGMDDKDQYLLPFTDTNHLKHCHWGRNNCNIEKIGLDELKHHLIIMIIYNYFGGNSDWEALQCNNSSWGEWLNCHYFESKSGIFYLDFLSCIKKQ